MTEIYIDADACPVREEVFRVAGRLGVNVIVVSNGSRPIRPPGLAFVRMVTVGEGPDVADDYIAERIADGDVCVTSDIPLASRCLAQGAGALAANGKIWSSDNIGSALAGRAVSSHMREMGMMTGGPPPLSRADRSKFLSALDTMLQASLREKRR
jgi:uncharacterized protein YaiI (UPF0178 family)